MTITRKHLLQWTSAAHTAFGLGARSPRAAPVARDDRVPAPRRSATAALVAWARPSALLVAAPLLLLWLFAPEIARWVSQPLELARRAAADRTSGVELRLLARRTWRFFDVFVGPNDQWLPIDNYQEEPHEQTAHRTSPTNIGMMLLSTLAAYDLGYLGPSELSLRVRSAFESIERLVALPGPPPQLVRDEEPPAAPAAVRLHGRQRQLRRDASWRSSKDAGRWRRRPVLRAAAWEALTDSLDLLEEVLESVAASKATRAARRRRSRCGVALERGRATSRRRVRDASASSATTTPPSSIASCSRCSRRARSGTTPTPSARFARRWTASTISSGRCGTRSTCCCPGWRWERRAGGTRR